MARGEYATSMPSAIGLARSQPRSERGVPSYGVNPIGQALQGAGEVIAHIGAVGQEKANENVQRDLKFGVATRYLQFEQSQREAATTRAESALPGAAGFVDGLKTDYTKSAKEFFASVPDELKPEYDLKLADLEGSLTEGAHKFATEEHDRYALETIGTAQNTLLDRQRLHPEQWAGTRQEGDALFSSSGLPPITADIERQKWRQRAAVDLFQTRQQANPEEYAKLTDGGRQMADPFMATPAAPAGLLQKGNIDLTKRPQVKNADGSVSTVASMSFEEDGKEILIPTVAADGSRLLSDQEAIDQYHKTGQQLGVFKDATAADRYADALHKQQDQMYVGTGATGSYADKVIGAESGGSATAQNPNSSATGSGQFIESTWAQFIRERHPELAAQGEDIQKYRNNRALSREAVQWYADQNASQLQQAGAPVTDGTLYLAHFAGPQGAIGLLKADPNASAESVLGSKVINANPFLRGKSAADVIAWADKKMGGSGSGPAPEYADIPYEDRIKLADASIAHNLTIEKAAHAAETEQEKEIREQTTKTGYDMMLADDTAPAGAPKQLTPAWVEANRDLLTVTDYKTFLKQFEPETTAKRTPPQEYIRLLDLAENDPQRAQEEVRTLYGNDVIAKDVFNTVMSRARANEQQKGGRNFSSELRSYVSTALTPERDAPQWQYARKLDALFQFDDFIDKNPRADRETLRKQAQSIVDDYHKIRYQQGTSSLPMPRFTLRTPQTLDIAELQNAMTKTMGSLQARMINEREAAEQAAVIRRWMDIVRYRGGSQ